MNCNSCMCKYGAVAILPGFPVNVDNSCTAMKFTRTSVADYRWCHVGGPPKDGSPGGWYPGRGYW